MATLLRGRTADCSCPVGQVHVRLLCCAVQNSFAGRARKRERGEREREREREGSVKEPHWHCLAFCNIMSLGTTSSLCQASQPGKLYPATTFHCFSLPPLRSPCCCYSRYKHNKSQTIPQTLVPLLRFVLLTQLAAVAAAAAAAG